MAELPADLRYTAEHEWVLTVAPSGGGDGAATVVRVGITDFAQEQLGDVVYVDLPAVGTRVAAGTTCGEIESTKSVSELYAPVTGVVVGRNDALDAAPEQVNVAPYEAGWLVEIEVEDPQSLDGLLDAAGYQALVG